MRYYKNGNRVIATKGTLPFEEITEEEYKAEFEAVEKQMEKERDRFEELPTEVERLEALEMAMLELAEVLVNG